MLDERPTFPLMANYDLTSSRYKKKPFLRNGQYVTLTGFLTRVTKDSAGKPDRFVIDLENVIHLGSAPPPPAPTSATPGEYQTCTATNSLSRTVCSDH